MYVSTYADMKLIPGFTFANRTCSIRVHVVRTTGRDLIQLIFDEYVHYDEQNGYDIPLNTYLIHLRLERAIKSSGKNIYRYLFPYLRYSNFDTPSFSPDPRDDETRETIVP